MSRGAISLAGDVDGSHVLVALDIDGRLDLAEELCTKKSTVSSYENDKIDIKISILQDIARILGTTVSYLVDGESIDAEAEEAAKLIMMISDSKLRRAAIEQIRVLADM